MSLITHYLHKWKIRLAILCGLILLWPLQNKLVEHLQNDAVIPYQIELKTPLPADILQRHGLPADAEIEKVYVSGSFSDWHSDDPYYALKPIAKEHGIEWQYSLPTFPGEIEYKLVVFIKNQPEPTWMLDPNNPDTVVSPWGDQNSVLHVSDWPKIALISQILTFALLGTFLLYCILEPLLFWLLHQKMPFYRKLVLSNILILICAQLLFFSYQLHLNRQLIKQGLIDSIHGMHLIFNGENIDFTALENQQDELNDILSRFFGPATTRVDKTQSSLFQITLSDFAVLDKQGKLITLSHRLQNQQLQQQRAEQLGFQSSSEYFMQGMWSALLPQTIANAQNGQLLVAVRPSKVQSVENPRTLTAEWLLGFSQFTQPILSRGQVLGYYAGSIQVKLYGAELLRMLMFQLLLLSGVVVLTSWLFARVGKIVTKDILQLTFWTQNIVKGNLSQELSINSQDEIQQLAENFDQMRHSLRDSFEQIEEQNCKLFKEAYFNTLTKLPNRKKLYSDLSDQGMTALLVVNINDFSEFNDFYGINSGDAIIIEVAERITQYCQTLTDWSVYKTGPDEFSIAYKPASAKSLTCDALADFATQLSNNICHKALVLDNNKFYISVSIGGAIIDSDTETTPDISADLTINTASDLPLQQQAISQSAISLHRHADLARRLAKKQRLIFSCFSAEMANPDAFEENMRQSQMLAKAAQNQWVTPYLQLIQPLKDTPIKFECLMRISLPNGQVLAPGQFMQAARQSRLYPQLMYCMMQKSIAMFKDQPYEFSLNITLDDIAIPQNLQAIISLLTANIDVCPRLTFELLESEEITDYRAVEQFIKTVKPLGCKIAIDDFGSGYSNFVHLLSLDIDAIKIDGSLIRHLDSDPKAQLLVATVAKFAQQMHIKTVAEFVENETVLGLLNQYNIDYAQGYLLGKPAPSIALALCTK
ncbi:EAL domain-containing protein [Shewanella aestuarii]|uniref:EAL domain-containing protein n=1 Tax=Shewanella aestuarii TaxID=1028752 RepID=A0A6G9QIA1_9GAMM|nr:EAL domain-containing protein [Shewanella aestuarii]QIR13873.1 EAL domain-containing protein [Shewanella aestuarii]